MRYAPYEMQNQKSICTDYFSKLLNEYGYGNIRIPKKNKSIQLKEICKNPEVYYFTEGHQFPIKNAKFLENLN